MFGPLEEKLMQILTRLVLFSLLLFGLEVGVETAQAANTAGTLDKTFGTNGVTLIDLGDSGSPSPTALGGPVLLQSDGKILAFVTLFLENSAGGFVGVTNELVRVTPEGALDTTFGKHGITTPSVGPGGAMLQPDGQLVIGGVITNPNQNIALAVERLNTNGTPDASFGSDGVATVNLGNRSALAESAVLVESNGDLLACASLFPAAKRQPAQLALARFTFKGVPDKTFGNEGLVIATATGGCTALAELSNGEILVVNEEAIAQFTADGSVESTVTGGPIVTSNGSITPLDANASLFQPNGDYLFAFEGISTGNGHRGSVQVSRFTETGAADPDFTNPNFLFSGSPGDGIEAGPHAMALQSNGDIVIVGAQIMLNRNAPATVIGGLARLTPRGDLDPTFGEDGLVVGVQGTGGVAIQPADGKIVTAGPANSTQLAVSRYLGK
jgi:uncharacterized delta-60 repeat protein